MPLYLAAVLSVLHSLVTTQAAPTMFSQRRYGADEAALAVVFTCFERWQALTFGTLLWAMMTYVR